MQYYDFIKLFYKKTKIDLGLYKEDRMKRRIDSFIKQHLGEVLYGEFLKELNKDIVLYDKFLDHLTINVTKFFRNQIVWDNLKNNVIPALLKSKNKISIWSAGCSTGEEPYSLAMLMDSNFSNANWSILATDLDKKVLSKSKNGIFTNEQIKSLDSVYRDKYFNIINSSDAQIDSVYGNTSFEVKSLLKNKIQFKQLNLLEDVFPTKVDLILCRNVVIYFTEEAKEKLYERFSNALNPGGVILIGNTEHISNYREIGLVKGSNWCFEKK